MSTTDSMIIDVAPLLAPISDESPAGESLKYTDPFNRITAARNRAESASVEGNEVPDWQEVIDLSVDALTTKTKDLNIGAYLTEALTREFSYAGLADGLRLMAGFLREFWDGVYPQVQDDSLDARLAPLIWLTSTDRGSRLTNRLRELPMAPSSDGSLVFSWRLWTKPAARPVEGEATESEDLELFRKAIAGANRAYYQKLVDDIHAAQEAFKDFESTLDERFGDQAPATSAFRDSLEACASLAEQFLDEKGGPTASSGDSDDDSDSNDTSDTDDSADSPGRSDSARNGSGSVQASGGSGPIRTREDALRRLEEAAAYLRENEPQSPVPYLIERAVSWGRMPFHQLLNELLADDNTRGQVRGLLGIRLSDSE